MDEHGNLLPAEELWVSGDAGSLDSLSYFGESESAVGFVYFCFDVKVSEERVLESNE